MDPRIRKLSQTLIQYSTGLQPGERVLIEVFDDAEPLAAALVEEAYGVGAVPFVTVKNTRLNRALILGCSQEQLQAVAEWEAARMKRMDAYIGVRAGMNASEMADVPQEKMELYQQEWIKPVHMDIRVRDTKWVILRYPSPSMAQSAGMSTAGFADFFYRVCTLDYARMAAAMDPLIELLARTDEVRITGPGTDIRFSVKGIPSVKCSGLRNIPDGEVYTAPVKDSVEGFITYNTPSLYQGFTYDNVRLEFRQGRIVKASANDDARINNLLDTDEGARYTGEFAFGLNPHIHAPMKDTLFDEKISGSFHLTPGNAYDSAFNGNRSAVHWDLVCIQTPAYGGGEIRFDGKVIRRDGRFILPELQGLNPENLK